MKFQTKLFKLMMRFSKDNGEFSKFKVRVNTVKKLQYIHTEEDIIKKLGNSPKNIIYYMLPPKICTDFFYHMYENDTNLKITFQKFLEDKELTETFRKNIDLEFMKNTRPFIDFEKPKKHDDNLLTIINTLMPYDYILSAFEWSRTKQEYKFWEKLNREWILNVELYTKEKYL